MIVRRSHDRPVDRRVLVREKRASFLHRNVTYQHRCQLFRGYLLSSRREQGIVYSLADSSERKSVATRRFRLARHIHINTFLLNTDAVDCRHALEDARVSSPSRTSRSSELFEPRYHLAPILPKSAISSDFESMFE